MPPITFGSTWRHVGTFRRYGHDLPLWLGAHSQAYSDAYKALRGALVGAGFSWTNRGHDEPGLAPCWWSERREAGIPDAREIDRAIVDAMRDAPLPPAYAGSGAQTHPREVVVVEVIRRAAHALHRRGFMPEASIPALVNRLSRDTGRAA